MVIVNVDLDAGSSDQFGEFPDAADVAGVHQHELANLIEVDRMDVGHVEEINHRADEKIPQIFLLGAREYDACVGIELLRRQQRGQGVEIRVDVRRNDRLCGRMIGSDQGVVQGLLSQIRGDECARGRAAAESSAYHIR